MSVRRAASLFVIALSVAGCGSHKLETGYQYTPLGDSPAQRRAYYAGPFSPEARNAMMSEGADSGLGASRRPNP